MFVLTGLLLIGLVGRKLFSISGVPTPSSDWFHRFNVRNASIYDSKNRMQVPAIMLENNIINLPNNRYIFLCASIT